MADRQLIDRAERAFYKTYNHFPTVFDHGQGVKLYGTEGNECLDFGTGVAIMGLGYGDEEYAKAVEEQLHKLAYISNPFYNRPATETGEGLLKVSRMDKVFFINSGTEAIEDALKIVKHYHHNKLHESMGDGAKGCGDVDADMTSEIIATNHSFHGRSLRALLVTDNAHHQEPFRPLVPGIRFANFNNLDSVRALINDGTCAVTMETIQGGGGIYPAEERFIKDVRAPCDGHDLLLILDGIQCGMGRSDETFAWQHCGVRPDVVTVTKALGNGLPVGASLARGKAADVITPGDHGTTYGGDPLVTAGANAVLDLFEKRHMVGHVRKAGTYLAEKLDRLINEFGVVKKRRGMGLIQGLEFAGPVGPVASSALLEQRLVLINAGADVIHLVPPLVIREGGVDEMILRLRWAIKASFQRGEMIREMLREKNDLPGAFLFPLLLDCLK